MFHVGTVAGGTNAGWRKVKQKPREWVHLCNCNDAYSPPNPVELPGYLPRCPDCKAARP